MAGIVENLIGKPEVTVKVAADDHVLVRIAVMLVIVVTLCLLIAAMVRRFAS